MIVVRLIHKNQEVREIRKDYNGFSIYFSDEKNMIDGNCVGFFSFSRILQYWVSHKWFGMYHFKDRTFDTKNVYIKYELSNFFKD